MLQERLAATPSELSTRLLHPQPRLPSNLVKQGTITSYTWKAKSDQGSLGSLLKW